MTERSAALRFRGSPIAYMAFSLVTLHCACSQALITGGVGNEPMDNPQWQAGTAAVFNTPARVAWWEGPPFGGGQYHAECRGDAKAFNQVIADFGKLDAKNKQLIIHDGVGASFWLNPNQTAEKKDAAKIDWIFMCWATGNWARAMQLPAGLRPAVEGDADEEPPTRIDVYTGGNINWDDVNIPAGIAIVDKRLATRGFSVKDGVVLEGNVVDLITKQPIPARMILQSIEAQDRGGYSYTVVATTAADDDGHWVAKSVPAGWYRILVEADGYVPRILGHLRTDGQPQWLSYDGSLAKPTSVMGHVVDGEGERLPGATVRLTDVETSVGGRYDSPVEYLAETDQNGDFELHGVPNGSAHVRVSKPGYCRVGLSPSVIVPANNLKMQLVEAAQLAVSVDFIDAERPKGYIVNIEPADGAGIGKWSGSGNIDGQNQIQFKNVPPGTYVLFGRPNPSSGNKKTKPVTIELKGGELTRLVLIAK